MTAKERLGIRLLLVLVIAVSAILFGVSAVFGQSFDEKLFNGLKWREIGPFRGGRVLAVAGVPGDPNVYYFGGVAGGVWKSTDGGASWIPLFDKQSISSIGSIAVASSDPNVLYVGTGEACIRGNISFGDGMYKSTDGGKTWQHIGLADTRHIGRVIVHPRDPDIVFVAALGHAYGPNTERGVFRSIDGGKTWEKVLYRDDKTGAIDVAFDPTNPRILFAALWEAARTPWSLSSGGPGSGLYKSTDGGTTWKRLEGNGLPKGILGRIGVAVSAADPNRVYALMEAEEGGLYRSEDAGEHWTRVNDDHRFRQRAWYFTHVFADPASADTVYVLNTGLFRSTDGGAKFTLLPAPHGDHHGLWIDPKNPKRMINSNDGGATITVDGGKSWTSQYNQPTAQFYHVITDNRFPYYVYGAQQDNSTVAIASRSGHGVIDRSDWYAVAGCESGYVAPDPRDANIVYGGCYDGIVGRFDKRTEQEQNVSPWPEYASGYGAGELKHRLQWTAPLVVSPHDPDVLYFGLEVLFKTANGGQNWTIISPDLTRNDKSKQGRSGGPITKDNTSVEYYDVIFTIAESPRQKDLVWVGTDDGLVHLTHDGKNWTNVTPKELPEWSMVSLVEASPHDAATAYIAVDGHKLDDYRPYIYKTADFGKTWKKITGGLPDHAYVHAVREDPKRKGLLYAGTETGVFVSFDDGAHWQPLQLNLPVTPIHDLVIKEDDLVVATHGRSFWILDDLTPLRQLTDQIAGAAAHLYAPRPTVRMRGLGAVRRGPVGENAPDGAIVYYYLKSAPNDEITLEVLDSQGKPVRKFSSKERVHPSAEQPEEWPEAEKPKERLPAEAGMNRFIWDLRYEGPSRVPGLVFDGGEAPKGPLALPGAYLLKLAVAGKSFTAPLEIRSDPRVSTSAADLQKEFDLARTIRDRISQAHDAVNQIRDLRGQLHGLRKRLGAAPAEKQFLAALDELDTKMTGVEQELVQVNQKASEDSLNYPVKLNDKLASLGRAAESADAAPARGAYEVLELLSQQLDTQLAAWREILAKDLAALNERLRKENIPMLSPAAS